MADERRVHRWYKTHRVLDYIVNVKVKWAWAIMRVVATLMLWVIATFIALIKFTDPTDPSLPEWAKQPFKTVHDSRFKIIVIFIVVEIACRFLLWAGKKFQGTDARKLAPILDELEAQVFPQQDRENHVYRATLFKIRRCPLFGAWLGNVARSGQLYPQKTTVFSISAKTRAHCTGIAGECWRREGNTVIVGLPDCRDAAPPEILAEYIKKGCLDPREFSAMNVKATVILASGIRISGRLWGIVVVDCTDAKTLPKQQKRYDGALAFAAIAVGKLLE